jgi:hypothetical protein
MQSVSLGAWVFRGVVVRPALSCGSRSNRDELQAVTIGIVTHNMRGKGEVVDYDRWLA